MWFRNDSMLTENGTLFHRVDTNGDTILLMAIDPSIKKIFGVVTTVGYIQPVYANFAIGWHRVVMSLNEFGDLRY